MNQIPHLQISLEYALLVAIISTTSTILLGQANNRRNRRIDDQLSASVIARLEVKLEHIDKGVGLVQHEMREINQQFIEHRERLVLVEASTGQAHKRIDDLVSRKQ